MRFPKWPGRLRSGAPAPGGVSPADPELVGIRLGLRRLIKRECRDPRDAEVASRWLHQAGLSVLQVTPVALDGQVVLLAAKEEALLGEALELELTARRHESEAAARFGTLLGYPSCCIESFAALQLRDDADLFRGLAGGPPAPVETLCMVGPLSLISHAPCSLHCEASVRLGRSLLDGLANTSPGFAEAWLELARRTHVAQASGELRSLRLDGDRIDHAVQWRVPLAEEAPWHALPELAGTRWTAADDELLCVHE
ncbi:MAG: DUF483 domain-containing protein [Polyangiaceae bacterium]